MSLFSSLFSNSKPSAARSPKWPGVEKAHLALHPVCERCGGKTKLNVHHIKPYHLYPTLELEPTNLITLCEQGTGGVNCHLAFGHLGDFKSYNVDVVQDTAIWKVKLLNKPFGVVEEA